MAIYDNNGTTNTEIGKLYDNNGSTSSQIHIVYDNNGTSSFEIYRAEETLFSGLTQETPGAYGVGQRTEIYSSEYTNNGYTSLAVTGTVGATVLGQGIYGYASFTQIQGYNGSSWVSLKQYTINRNDDYSMSAAATVNISGYSKIRVYTVCQRENLDQSTQAKAWTNNLKGIAS